MFMPVSPLVRFVILIGVARVFFFELFRRVEFRVATKCPSASVSDFVFYQIGATITEPVTLSVVLFSVFHLSATKMALVELFFHSRSGNTEETRAINAVRFRIVGVVIVFFARVATPAAFGVLHLLHHFVQCAVIVREAIIHFT